MKVKKIRGIARRLAKTEETTYNIGQPPLFNTEGKRIRPGVPTTMKKDCLKYIVKQMKWKSI